MDEVLPIADTPTTNTVPLTISTQWAEYVLAAKGSEVRTMRHVLGRVLEIMETAPDSIYQMPCLNPDLDYVDDDEAASYTIAVEDWCVSAGINSQLLSTEIDIYDLVYVLDYDEYGDFGSYLQRYQINNRDRSHGDRIDLATLIETIRATRFQEKIMQEKCQEVVAYMQESVEGFELNLPVSVFRHNLFDNVGFARYNGCYNQQHLLTTWDRGKFSLPIQGRNLAGAYADLEGMLAHELTHAYQAEHHIQSGLFATVEVGNHVGTDEMIEELGTVEDALHTGIEETNAIFPLIEGSAVLMQVYYLYMKSDAFMASDSRAMYTVSASDMLSVLQEQKEENSAEDTKSGQCTLAKYADGLTIFYDLMKRIGISGVLETVRQMDIERIKDFTPQQTQEMYLHPLESIPKVQS